MVHLICLKKEIFSGLSVLVEMERKKNRMEFLKGNKRLHGQTPDREP